jgi:hypothetical protein
MQPVVQNYFPYEFTLKDSQKQVQPCLKSVIPLQENGKDTRVWIISNMFTIFALLFENRQFCPSAVQ